MDNGKGEFSLRQVFSKALVFLVLKSTRKDITSLHLLTMSQQRRLHPPQGFVQCNTVKDVLRLESFVAATHLFRVEIGEIISDLEIETQVVTEWLQVSAGRN